MAQCRIAHKSGGSWVGECVDGKPCGRGKCTYANGDVYEGQWADKPNGSGKIKYSAGDKYDHYEGEWENGKWHGNGTLKFADGRFYVGEFRKGKRHGEGETTFANGNSYEGEFKEGKWHGKGTHKWADGSRYEGDWVKGKSKGTHTWTNGDQYEGEWAGSRMNGSGTMKWSNGSTFRGVWKKDERCGRGTFTWADGREYEGEWINDKKHGKGTIKYPDGRVFRGIWLNGKKHGSGMMREADGSHLKQEYRNGNLISSKRNTTFSNEPPSQRPRTGNAVDDVFAIAALPAGALGYVASYLATPSRAMLAAALTAPSSLWASAASVGWQQRLSEASRAIVDSSPGQWGSIDFEDIERCLAKMLTDEDLCAILTVIDAVNNTKSLKLAGCVKIVGRGLEPLRASMVLEKIDLSLVGRLEKPRSIVPDPNISEDVVIPILDSIISVDATTLRHIQYPYKWRHQNQRCQPNILEAFVPGTSPRNEPNPSVQLRRFIGKCNVALRNLQLSCSYCKVIIPGGMWSITGLQCRACHECKRYFCSQCEGEQDTSLCRCRYCERACCVECVQMQWCGFCRSYCCLNCIRKETEYEDFLVCSLCDVATCGECLNECESCGYICCKDCADNWWYRCDSGGCTKHCCDDCFDDGKSSLEFCDVCCSTYCPNCRVGDCRIDGKGEC